MRRLEFHNDVLCAEDLLQTPEYLLVQSLLDLRPPREVFDYTVKLGEANHLSIAEVAYMSDTCEEQEMVLTH